MENNIYVSHEYNPSPKWNFIYGLRISMFNNLGAGTYYIYDKEGNVTQTNTYKSGEIFHTYINPEPRASVSYILNEQSSLKGGYSRNAQYMHLISNSTSSNPTDLWINSTKFVKPQLSDQVSLGYFRNFERNNYEFSVETYYKALQNQIDYRNGANTFSNNSKIEGELLFGKGRAYGIEFFFKKKVGKLTGWIGYTLSRSEKQIDGINNSQYYPARQDRTHDISIVGIYQLNDRWVLSSTFVYYTGNAITFPTGKYSVDNQVAFLYTERNGYRMPDYHRLDLGATYTNKKHKKYESSWNFSIYNAYAHANAYTITFQKSDTDPNKTEAVRTALFKMVPSVSYNFKF
jgi:hypothetical protein